VNMRGFVKGMASSGFGRLQVERPREHRSGHDVGAVI
jgi:hypothetical protein